MVRICKAGSKYFYFRYPQKLGRKLVALGPYSKNAKLGHLTLQQARSVANSLISNALTGDPHPLRFDPKVHLEQNINESRRSVQNNPTTPQKTQPSERQASSISLCDLCSAYIEDLNYRKRSSAASTSSLMRLYISSNPLGDLPANSISSIQLTKLLREIVGAGKGRTAAKVRSLLHAAYEFGSKTECNPSTMEEMENFGISINPVKKISSLSNFNKTRSRALNKKELATFWEALNLNGSSETRIQIRFIRIALLLGGQRCKQLVRAKIDDVDMVEETIMLFDPKGRRAQPRFHLLPLASRCQKEISWLIDYARDAGSPHLFPGQDPNKPIWTDAISKTVTKISRDLQKRHGILPFQYSDIRRTTESHFAALGIEPEVRAQVLSHGLSGIQIRNYNRHEYMDEKRAALTKWNDFINSIQIEI